MKNKIISPKKSVLSLVAVFIAAITTFVAAGFNKTVRADSVNLTERYEKAEGLKIDATGVKSEVRITADENLRATKTEYLVLDMRVDSVEHASGDIYAFYQIILVDESGAEHNLDSKKRIENVTTAGFTVPNKPFDDTSWYLVKTGFNGKIYIELADVLDEDVTVKELVLLGDTSHKNHYLLRDIFVADKVNATSGKGVTDFNNLAFDESGKLTSEKFASKRCELTANYETQYDVKDGYAENGRLKSLVIKTEGYAEITLSSESPVNARSAILINFNALSEKGIKVKISLVYNGERANLDYTANKEYSFATGDYEYGKVAADGEAIVIGKGLNGTLCLPYGEFDKKVTLISEIVISIDTSGEYAEIGNVTEYSSLGTENKNTVYCFADGNERITATFNGNETHKLNEYSDLYKVSVNVSGGGGPAEYKVEKGILTFTAKPNTGYSVKTFIVNGEEKKLTANEYVTELTRDTEFKISYKLSGIETEVNDKDGATVYYVKSGAKVTFNAVLNEGYLIERAELNGEAVPLEDNSYEAKNLTDDATFKVTVRKIRIETESVGKGKAEYEIKNGRIRFSFKAEEGFELKKISVNGKSTGLPTETYYVNYDKDVTVKAEFGKKYDKPAEEEKKGCTANADGAGIIAAAITLAGALIVVGKNKKKVNK